MRAQWSQVESAMQRRADLIPNLVSTVKGFATHETEVFKDIADARAAMAGGADAAGENRRQRSAERRASAACWWWRRIIRS